VRLIAENPASEVFVAEAPGKGKAASAMQRGNSELAARLERDETAALEKTSQGGAADVMSSALQPGDGLPRRAPRVALNPAQSVVLRPLWQARASARSRAPLGGSMAIETLQHPIHGGGIGAYHLGDAVRLEALGGQRYDALTTMLLRRNHEILEILSLKSLLGPTKDILPT